MPMINIKQSNQILRAVRLSKSRGWDVYLDESVSSSPAFAAEAAKAFTSPFENGRFTLVVTRGEVLLENSMPHFVGCGYSITAKVIEISPSRAVEMIKAAYH